MPDISQTNRIPFALFLLRIGLGGFLLIWAVEKIVKPETTIRIFDTFYKMDISSGVSMAMGVAQILLGLAIMVGFLKTVSYGLGLLIHGLSTLSTYDQLIHPFTRGNHLFLAAIPILIAFVVLFILRNEDNFLILDLES